MRLLDEHEEALEADLRREYQADLRDVYRGRMDWRELRVLVNGLPSTGTALARSIHGPAGDWTPGDELLRLIANVNAEHTWGFFESNRDRAKTREPIPRPEPIPSPFEKSGEDDPAPRTAAGKRVATASETFAVLQNALGM